MKSLCARGLMALPELQVESYNASRIKRDKAKKCIYTGALSVRILGGDASGRRYNEMYQSSLCPLSCGARRDF